MKKLILTTCCVIMTLLSAQLFAQNASLSVQGVLRSPNGTAVDDGNYDLTFKIYTQESGGTEIWTETQSGVQVELIDATYGRRTRAVIITDSSHVVLSAIQPETVAHRFVVNKDGKDS